MLTSDRLYNTLVAVNQVIEKLGGKGVLIGGIALGLVATPRATKDVDALVLAPLDEPERVWQVAEPLGFKLKSSQSLEDARLTRFLRLSYEPSDVDVDFQIGIWQYDYEAIERGLAKSYEGIPLRVASPEDLVILKTVAARPQDLVDVETIFRVVPNLDREYIRGVLMDFRDFVKHQEVLDRIMQSHLS